MPITITSTTDSPEDVAAAMSASGAEIEKDEVVEESKSAAEVKDKPEKMKMRTKSRVSMVLA